MGDKLTEHERNAVNYLKHAIVVEDAKIVEATAKKAALTEAMWSIETILERGHERAKTAEANFDEEMSE